MQQLGRTVLIGSGALGTSLRQTADIPGLPVEFLNLRNPESVIALHKAYRASGSQILVTNTFAANRLALNEAGLANQCREINEAGVRLARAAADKDCLVWASVGPLSLGLRHDDFKVSELNALYGEQCEALRGADALVLETFVDPREAQAALETAKASGIPTVFQIGNVGSGRDRWERIGRLVELAQAAGVVALGTNCQHPNEIVQTAEFLLSRTGLPVTASPNAGHPRIDRGLVQYEFSPEDLRKIGERLVALGVAVVGGCCGTTPDHIRGLASVRGRPVTTRKPLEIRTGAEPAARAEKRVRENRVRSLIREQRFVISVEIRADRKSSVDQIVAGAAEIAEAGADMFDVPDNPGATVGRDAAVVAAKLQAGLKIPAIPHKSVIQSNMLQTHSSLLGAWDLGLQGLLVVTGDPPSMGHLSGMAKIVSDMKSSVEMLRLIRSLRDGKMINGEEVGDPPDFCAGSAVGQATKQQINWLQKKVEAGVEFVFSQPVFGVDDFRRLQENVSPLPIRFFPGVMPLAGLKNAEFLAGGRIPGIRIPEGVVESFRRFASPEDQRRFGLDNASELALTIAREGRGIYLIMPFGRRCYSDTAQIVRSLRGSA
jgi:homocysteine S-methyltransferase